MHDIYEFNMMILYPLLYSVVPFDSRIKNATRLDFLFLWGTCSIVQVSRFQCLMTYELQMILCAAVKFFRGGKKDTTVGEVCFLYLK